MAIFDFLRRKSGSAGAAPRRRADAAGSPLLPRIEARLPPDGGPGLLPPGDPDEAAAEKRLGDRFASELHLLGRGPDPLFAAARRLAAIAFAARRRNVDELREAVDGVAPWELPDLLDALAHRKDLQAARLAETARGFAERAADYPALAAALALIAADVGEGDRPMLLLAGRSPALAGICALALEKLPVGSIDPALLELAEGSTGLARSLALERLALRHLEDPAGFEPLALQALSLAAEIEDPLERAWAAVPLLEAARADERLASEPDRVAPVLACLEAVARGGWNGGPGPGLARLPGALRTAQAILGLEGIDEEQRRIAASAVLDARPMPAGAVRLTAEKVIARHAGT